ncbi:hypothetical protein D9756_008080 [Leucocoprinus leucothites]|uniref:P-loop containing nucleoside triphosphate hydrolase protein n=1 Tax=Leucocoprinus leucothites TaxID=201217 RepID=A0A8H5D5C3_9AGAR|nr:hypothetical protein D9756_008080 [Leucoagaricus leucothites]
MCTPLRQSHSAALAKPYAGASSTYNTGGVYATEEDTWYEPDELIPSTNASPPEHNAFDPDKAPPRFDWRNCKSSRIVIPQSTPTARRRYPHRKVPTLPVTESTDPYHGAIKNYHNHFLPLLRKEEEENGNEVFERLKTWSLERLKSEGYCLTDVVAYWTKNNSYGKAVAVFQVGAGVCLPENLKFGNGYKIMVSRKNPLQEQADLDVETPITGSIVELTETKLKIAFPHEFDESGLWRLDLGMTNFIFERMRAAVSALHYDVDILEREPRTDKVEPILLGTGLKDVLLRSGSPATRTLSREHQEFHALQAPDDVSYPKDVLSHDVREFAPESFRGVFKDDMRIHSWAERYSLDEPLVIEGDPDLSHLNGSQIKAMATMVSKRISLVQGPPGTGKTKTIIETIKLLRAHFEVPFPILVCTYTNVAVDNLLEGFGNAGLKPLRVGFNACLRESLKEYSLDEKLAKHPLQDLYAATEKALRDLEPKIDDLSSRLKETVKKAQKSNSTELMKRSQNMYRAFRAMERERFWLKGKLWGLQQEMLHDIVKAADVNIRPPDDEVHSAPFWSVSRFALVCTTCITAASSSLNVSDFPVVFIDEASMSTEPATLIPIMKGEAQAKGLGVSLFERLTEEGIVPSVMLDVQYRMHPSISYFPSSEFYNSSIQDGTMDKEGNVMSGLEPLLSSTHLLQELGDISEEEGSARLRPSVIFLDHNGREQMSGRSRLNYPEAQIVVSLVEDLLLHNPQLRGRDIGIIAPYVAQINLLTRILSMSDLNYRQRFNEVLGNQRYHEMGEVEVKTVDGFEGREKEVIIFSTVRNNREGKIGFLADRRRLNVGLTRAKRGLFVVGSITTLGSHGPGIVGTIAATATSTRSEVEKKPRGRGADSWKRYAEWLAREGLVLKLEGENLSRTLFGNRRREEASKTKLKG